MQSLIIIAALLASTPLLAKERPLSNAEAKTLSEETLDRIYPMCEEYMLSANQNQEGFFFSQKFPKQPDVAFFAMSVCKAYREGWTDRMMVISDPNWVTKMPNLSNKPSK